VLIRSIVIVSVLGVASAAAAQTPMEAQVTQETLRQVQGFENSLRAAIEKAGAQLFERARDVVSDINLRFETQPRIVGIVLPESEGLLFMVDVPGIEATSAKLWEMSRNLAQPMNPVLPRVGNPVPPVPPASGAGAGAAPFSNPVQEYSEYTRQALLDAMLDFAFALPVRENQNLTLSVGVASVGPANPLAPIPRRLYLRLKGEDLIALRQNRITRDEAKKRIREFRY
jgi:hypothetical protein